MGKYVLQMKERPWASTWINLGLSYNTLDEAKAALTERKPKSDYRIAEAYTVTSDEIWNRR